jgi:hypothetical protein
VRAPLGRHCTSRRRDNGAAGPLRVSETQARARLEMLALRQIVCVQMIFAQIGAATSVQLRIADFDDTLKALVEHAGP